MIERLRTDKEIVETPGILRIGVDIDGCVASTGCIARKIIGEKTGIDVAGLYKRKNGRLYYFNDWAEFATNQEALEVINNLYKNVDLYKEAPAIPGSIKRLQEWYKFGHQIWFITARPDEVKEATREWFVRVGLSWVRPESLIFPKGLSPREQFKAKIASKLKLHAFIEDHAATLEAISNPDLMVKILLGRKYNSTETLGPGTLRYRSWNKVDELIREASSRHFQKYAS